MSSSYLVYWTVFKVAGSHDEVDVVDDLVVIDDNAVLLVALK